MANSLRQRGAGAAQEMVSVKPSDSWAIPRHGKGACHGPNANRMDMRRAKVSSPGLGSASCSARDPLRDEGLRVWLSAFAYGYGMVSMLKLYENINLQPANLFL